jgi:stress-induced morphogen
VTNNISLVITSTAFKGKPQLARHRMVNSLMKDEMAREGGIHALQLTTRTPEEDEARKQKDATA